MIKTAPPVASGAPSGSAAGSKARPKPKTKKTGDADAADADKQKAKRRCVQFPFPMSRVCGGAAFCRCRPRRFCPAQHWLYCVLTLCVYVCAGATFSSRPPQKKREADDAEVDGRPHHRHHASPAPAHAPFDQADLLESPERLHDAQTAHLDQMHLRAPRLLPTDVQGIKSLSQSEIQSDLKRIQQSMAAFEARVASMIPGGSGGVKDGRVALLAVADESDDDLAGMPYGNMLRDRRMHRNDGVVAPEEIIESVPVARRAVKITERELRALKRERDDLERDFMRLRTTYVWQMGEMKRMQKQQDRVMHILSRDVIRKAKSLESSRRRTSALQDIMTELDARGSAIMRLTREKYQLEALLRKHNVELPEIEEVFIGDRVKCTPFGFGQVAELNDEARIVVVDLDIGGRAYLQEEDVEVVSSEITYLEAEQELKLKFFEKIGALVQPNGKFSMLGTGSSGRGRGRNGSDGDLDDDESDDESQSMDDEEDASSDADADDGAEKDGDKPDDQATSGKARRRDGVVEHLKKKRKLIMNPSTPGSTSKKKSKLQKVINFPATTLPIAPYEKGLLVSPLSTLPERVAAVGPSALQWLPSYLPSNMHEWEQERYQSLQMKGEIERLRFQLQKAEGAWWWLLFILQ